MTSVVTYYPFSPDDIRDGTVQRLQASVIGFKNVFRQRTIPTKDSQLPLAAIWTLRDRTAPNGDSNVGAPSFIHTLGLAIDIAAAANDDASLDAKLTAMAEGVRNTLLTDASWVQLFEGIEGCSIHYSYPPNGDLTLGIATIELEVTFRSEWPPIEENDFTQVAIATNDPGAMPPRRYDGYQTGFSLPGTAQ